MVFNPGCCWAITAGNGPRAGATCACQAIGIAAKRAIPSLPLQVPKITSFGMPRGARVFGAYTGG
jgi:hypothetical protein